MVKDMAPSMTRYLFDNNLFTSVRFSGSFPEIMIKAAETTGNSATYPGKFQSLGNAIPMLKRIKTPRKEMIDAVFLFNLI